MRALVILPVVLALGAARAQQADPPQREGGYWTQTVTGRTAASGAVRLRVSAPGEISLRGDDTADLRYRLHKRVRAATEPAARRHLERILVETVRRGQWMELSVRLPAGADAAASLRLEVPQALREVWLASRAGGVVTGRLRGNLRVESLGGLIVVEDVAGGVELRTGGGSVRLARIGGPARCFSGGGSIAAEDLRAPAELVTGGGEITVRGARGPVRASTGGGSIRVERAASVSAATAGGSIEIADVPGQVAAETAAGPIRVRQARGIRVKSGSGMIQLEGIEGPLNAATGFGDIVLALTAARRLGNSDLRTDAGDITVFVPSNLAVTVEAVAGAEHANIVSEFAEIQSRRLPQGAQARGSLNGGGPVLRLAASGGTVYLRRTHPPVQGTSNQP